MIADQCRDPSDGIEVSSVSMNTEGVNGQRPSEGLTRFVSRWSL
jgi:hypothetical protein